MLPVDGVDVGTCNIYNQKLEMTFRRTGLPTKDDNFMRTWKYAWIKQSIIVNG